uniref:Mitochondrial ribosomal protein L4 n=1 Tax=Cyprinodon variegatus TaxID=28743 RepID=A0A3Q2ECR1_CYPVA
MFLKILSTSSVWFFPTERPPPPADSPLPLLRKCNAAIPAHLSPVQTWVETLEGQDSQPLGLTELHPDVFAVAPRLDILHAVETWQRNYKRIVGFLMDQEDPTVTITCYP